MNELTKEDVENTYPVGSKVELLGTNNLGLIIGNHRLLHPQYKSPVVDDNTSSGIKQELHELEKYPEWFVDVQVNGKVKPLNIMMLLPYQQPVVEKEIEIDVDMDELLDDEYSMSESHHQTVKV